MAHGSARAPAASPVGLTPLALLETNAGAITAFTWSPGGELCATGSLNGELRVWQWAAGRAQAVLDLSPAARINCFAWAPSGRLLAAGCDDGQLCIFDCTTWEALPAGFASPSSIHSLVWSQEEDLIIAGCREPLVRVWRVADGQLVRCPRIHDNWVRKVMLGDARNLLSSGDDGSIRSWNLETGELLQTLGKGAPLLDLCRQPGTSTLAAGGNDRIVRLWDLASGRELNGLEGHTASIVTCSFSSDGSLLASKGRDRTCRIWRTDNWREVALLPDELRHPPRREIAAFHPREPLLALLGAKESMLRIWRVDTVTLDAQPGTGLRYVTAKVALVGDHAVGKTSLAARLVSGRFESRNATHGQQFWVFDSLGVIPSRDIECEAILWDFAGQPDYRLIHSLFFDDTDVALFLYESSNRREPLHGVEYWLRQLAATEGQKCRRILVASQIDCGTASLTDEEIRAFCTAHQIDAFVPTSALTGAGCEQLLQTIRNQIDWSALPSIITTHTFKRIRDFVLKLKAAPPSNKTLLTRAELCALLAPEHTNEPELSPDDVGTAVTHLAKHGYVSVLNGLSAERVILLDPTRLNNLLASIVLKARSNPRGLGAVDEHRLLRGEMAFPELTEFDERERTLLLLNAVELFLRHNICFRKAAGPDQLLVFPGLIHLKKPEPSAEALVDDVSYVVSGAVDHVYAELVVLLGYTNLFTRTNQWHNQAHYEVGQGEVCGFRLAEDHDGEIVLVLQFAEATPDTARALFQAAFEQILASAKARVVRVPLCACENALCGYRPTREEVAQHAAARRSEFFCGNCGRKIRLPARVPVTRSAPRPEKSAAELDIARQRSSFEASLSFLNANSTRPSCFISYAWGNAVHKSFVAQLAEDLAKANVDLVWDAQNRTGESLTRFISRIPQCEKVLVIGTPAYRKKYENKGAAGTIVAAELDLIEQRLCGTEAEKATVLPLLLEGDASDAFPPLLRGRIYADYRDSAQYFLEFLNLVADVHGIPREHDQLRAAREKLGAG